MLLPGGDSGQAPSTANQQGGSDLQPGPHAVLREAARPPPRARLHPSAPCQPEGFWGPDLPRRRLALFVKLVGTP